MSLIKCFECNADVSDRALACPHCGFPIREEVERLAAKETEEKRIQELKHTTESKLHTMAVKIAVDFVDSAYWDIVWAYEDLNPDFHTNPMITANIYDSLTRNNSYDCDYFCNEFSSWLENTIDWLQYGEDESYYEYDDDNEEDEDGERNYIEEALRCYCDSDFQYDKDFTLDELKSAVGSVAEQMFTQWMEIAAEVNRHEAIAHNWTESERIHVARPYYDENGKLRSRGYFCNELSDDMDKLDYIEYIYNHFEV